MRIRFAIVMFLAAFASAQAPVEMTQEAHHSLLLQNNLIRVFKVSLNPNEQMQVIHTHNFLVVALDDCDVSMWREGGPEVQSYYLHQGGLRFYFAGQPIATRNNRATLCRSVMVEFLDPRVSTYGYQWFDNGQWDYGISGVDWRQDQQGKFVNILRLGRAVAMGVQLFPNDAFSPPPRSVGELLIPLGDVDLERNKARIHKSAGEAVWTVAGQKADLLNVEAAPAQFVVVALF